MSDFATSMAALDGVMRGLNETILSGWPYEDYPSEQEGAAIEATFHELGLNEPAMRESRRWYLAGRIVARIRRDT